MSCNRCANQATATMAAAGVPSRQTHATWAMVYQHLPRCGGCGRWMSPRNPQCAYEHCRVRGQMQGERRPWPPALVAFTTDRGQAGQAVGDANVLERMARQRWGESVGALGHQLAAHADQATVDRLATDQGLSPDIRDPLISRASRPVIRRIAATPDEFFPARLTAVHNLDDRETLEAILEGTPSASGLCSIIRIRLDELDLTEEQAVLAARNGAGRRTPPRCDRCGAFLPRSGDCRNARCPTNREATAAASDVATGEASTLRRLLAPRERDAPNLLAVEGVIGRIANPDVIDLLAVDRGLSVPTRRLLVRRASQQTMRQIASTHDEDLRLRAEAIFHMRVAPEALDAYGEMLSNLYAATPGLREAVRRRHNDLGPREGQVTLAPRDDEGIVQGQVATDLASAGSRRHSAARRMPPRCDRCQAFLPRSGDCRNPRCPTNREATAAASARATDAAPVQEQPSTTPDAATVQEDAVAASDAQYWADLAYLVPPRVSEWSATRQRNEMLHLVLDTGEVGEVEVQSSSGQTYMVERGEGCNCPQHRYRSHLGPCRHMTAVETAMGRYSAEALSWWRGGAAPSTDARVADDPPPADVPTYAHQVEPDSEAAAWTARRQTEAVVNDAREQAEMNEALDAFRRRLAEGGTGRPARFQDDEVWQAAREYVRQVPYEYEYEDVLNGAPITFGVEIECMPSDDQDEGFAQRVVDRLRAEGLTTQRRRQEYHQGAQNNGQHVWGIERDGSLDFNGIEVISPILSDDPEHWRQLERICQIIQEEGGTVDQRCGGHVHVGAERALDTEPQRWRRLARVYGAFQDVIYRMSAQGERHRGAGRNYTYSRPLNSSRLRPRFGSMNDVYRFASGFRGGLNYQHARSHRIEFRQFDGSVDAARIQQNVRLATGMVMGSSETIPVRRLPDPQRIGQHQRQGDAADDSSVQRFLDLVFRDGRNSDKIAALRLYEQGAWQPA